MQFNRRLFSISFAEESIDSVIHADGLWMAELRDVMDMVDKFVVVLDEQECAGFLVSLRLACKIKAFLFEEVTDARGDKDGNIQFRIMRSDVQ